MGPGDYFCCAPIFTQERYMVTAIALEDSFLITIPAGEFKKDLEMN